MKNKSKQTKSKNKNKTKQKNKKMRHFPITFFTPKPLLPTKKCSRKVEKQHEKRFKTTEFMKTSMENFYENFYLYLLLRQYCSTTKEKLLTPLPASLCKALVNTRKVHRFSITLFDVFCQTWYFSRKNYCSWKQYSTAIIFKDTEFRDHGCNRNN